MAKKKDDIINEEVAVETVVEEKAAEIADDEISVDEIIVDETEQVVPEIIEEADVEPEELEDVFDEVVLPEKSKGITTLKNKLILVGAVVAAISIVAGVLAYLYKRWK